MLHCACKAPQCCCLVHLEPPHAGSGSPQDGAPTPAKHQLYYSSIYGQCERVSGQLTVLHYILKLFDHIHVLFMPCKLKHLVLSENQLWILLGKITELSPDSNIVSAQTQPTSGTRGLCVDSAWSRHHVAVWEVLSNSQKWCTIVLGASVRMVSKLQANL